MRVAALKIDLPVIARPAGLPGLQRRDVSTRIDRLGQPGEGRATYLYAHARTGMFLPLLTQSKVSNGKKMLGMVVEVWTSDDQRFLYVITQVTPPRPDDGAFSAPFAAKTEQLWLQTSEGTGTQPKLQVVAEPCRRRPRRTPRRNPVAKPVNCALSVGRPRPRPAGSPES